MKANLSAIAALLLCASFGILPAALGAEQVDDPTLLEGMEESEPALADSPYAPMPTAYQWGREAGLLEAWFSIEPAPVPHPSLAADLVDSARVLPSEELLAVELQDPAAGEAAELDEQVTVPVRTDPEADRAEKRIHNVTGIPHPAAAGVAALVGLVLIVGRKERNH